MISDPYEIHRKNAVGTYPPNIIKISAVLPAAINDTSIVYTYDGKIYTPGNLYLPNDLVHHEMVHMRQQGDDPDGWWDSYLEDVEFRFDQELEAYTAQWEYIKNDPSFNRERRRAFKTFIAESISSPMYGNIISTKAAKKLFV